MLTSVSGCSGTALWAGIPWPATNGAVRRAQISDEGSATYSIDVKLGVSQSHVRTRQREVAVGAPSDGKGAVANSEVVGLPVGRADCHNRLIQTSLSGRHC